MRCEYRMEEIIQGKHFSITDPPEVNTVIYQVNKTPKEELKENSPKFTVERLDFTEELVGEKKRKTFYGQSEKICKNKADEFLKIKARNLSKEKEEITVTYRY